MKCNVVCDRNGKIVSVGYIDRPDLEEDGVALRFGPAPETGQTVVELYAPDECATMPLEDLIERLQADLNARQRPARKGK